ncbi:MAG TPA: LuxR C-terminal-related transcriptional regulator, partial [Prolixibacteraceae bacterium]|nr:LuxR C-terminal-related transcriptional regulator [Prolixibacteraceae bacterium]
EGNSDWEFFQEAFNKADRDFLKKLKEAHPLLTPNDLKLCVYLRLNMSSKEIAPMLNISPQSVEIKRFRLRKKLELDHEQNLTEYILNL